MMMTPNCGSPMLVNIESSSPNSSYRFNDLDDSATRRCAEISGIKVEASHSVANPATQWYSSGKSLAAYSRAKGPTISGWTFA
jgi:hypothetical protein